LAIKAGLLLLQGQYLFLSSGDFCAQAEDFGVFVGGKALGRRHEEGICVKDNLRS
jgi:hypothetical protein